MKIHDPSDQSRINDIVDSIIDEHAKKVALQTLRTVSKDEQIYVQCMAFYDAVKKNPRGFMHRHHVRTLRWMLQHVSDPGLMQCVEAQAPGVLQKMDNARDVFARVATIILKARGVGRTSVLVN